MNLWRKYNFGGRVEGGGGGGVGNGSLSWSLISLFKICGLDCTDPEAKMVKLSYVTTRGALDYWLFQHWRPPPLEKNGMCPCGHTQGLEPLRVM